MTWTIHGVAEAVDRFSSLEPLDVLYELETPKIFTAKLGHDLVLVYESSIDLLKRNIRFLIVPTSSTTLSALKNGTRTVIQALDQPWVWLVMQNFEGEITEAYQLIDGIRSVPEGFKPAKSAMLWPELTPLVSVRLIGEGLSEGHVPASVIKRAAESIPSALKKCFEGVLGARGQGRPDESIRSRYDLEAQHMAFASFEISFRETAQPELEMKTELGEELYQEPGAALQDAIEWAIESEAEMEAPEVGFIEALEKLVPPMHGVVKAVEVRGRIFPNSKRYVLNRATTKKVKQYLTTHRAAERTLVTVEGLIDELDKGRLTFIMRETPDRIDKTFTFAEEFLDDVFMAFSSSAKVNVSGRHTAKKQPIELLGIDFLNPVSATDV
jgi:hypothetical protein